MSFGRDKAILVRANVGKGQETAGTTAVVHHSPQTGREPLGYTARLLPDWPPRPPLRSLSTGPTEDLPASVHCLHLQESLHSLQRKLLNVDEIV